MSFVVLIEPPHADLGNISRFYGAFGTSKADFIWPPLELMSIGGYLDKSKIANVIYDAGGMGKTFAEVQDFIRKEKPKIVVFSTSTTTIYFDIKVAEKAKEISEDIITVAIGSHVMSLPEETLKLSRYLDVTVYSEDEEIIVKNLVDCRGDLSKVKGIYFRNKNGEMIKNPPQETTANLDELGFPAHDKIRKEIYRDPMTKRTPMALVMAQRGCINKCTFCICPVLYKYRERSVEHVMEELRWIEKLGYKEFKFVNAGTTYNINWANRLMDEILKAKLNLTWWTNVRADRLNEELLVKMKKAGCHTLAIGLESADPQILKNIGKNITPEKVRETINMAQKIGLRTAVYFILGLPGETKGTLQKTIDFAKSLKADFITMGVAQPLPGTKFYQEMKARGLIITNDWSKYDPVKAPVYYYPQLSADEIFKATRQGYRQFYLRPTYILKRILLMRSFGEFKNNLKNFIGFIKRYA